MERAQHNEAGGVVAAQDIAASLSCVKTAIMDVLLQIDYIRLQENPRIEADYAVKVGYLENELLEVQVAARRAKRKLTLAQAAANRGVKLQESALEAQLDEEFAEWTRRIEQAVSRFYVLVDYRCGLQALSNAESEELCHLYRMLVKRLHPDVNPEQSEKDTRVAAVERTPGAAKAAQEILVGDELSFIRQPEHVDSCWAIRVTNRQGNVVGYVARDVEEILARLMDGGKRVYGKVTDVSLHGQHTNVRMEVYLDD